MADFEPPSFSLGLGLDCESENQISSAIQDSGPSSSNRLSTVTDNDDGFETLIVDDSEPEYPVPDPHPKRLRRLLTVSATKSSSIVVNNEDVHVLSSQEDRRTEVPWEDLEKNFCVPRPAMDEACVTRSSVDLDDSLAPAHRYFFHDDLRIQELVRRRLPYFFPLSKVSNRDLEQPCTSNIDYMGQFGRGESSKHADRNIKDKKSSTRGKISRTKNEDSSQGWVNPKLGVDKGITKGAEKRKVRVGQKSSGRWLTGVDGKKVYIGKKGQELTGRVAYMQYRKESESGSKKEKRKYARKKQK